MPVKNKEGAYEKIMSISKNYDYTTGNLLDYKHFSKRYELIAIDLSKQNWIKKSWVKPANWFYLQTWKW